jgi:hypothetical protein
VHKVSQVGAEQARIALQVDILEWFGTAAKLTVHLAQVSQVDQVQWAWESVLGQARHQDRQDRQAHLAGGLGSGLLTEKLSAHHRCSIREGAHRFDGVIRSLCFKSAIKNAKRAKRGWLALLEVGFSFSQLW